MSSQAWKEANKDRMKEWSKQYYWQNKDKILAQQKLRQQEKKEEIKSQKVKYRATHKAEISARDQTPSRRRQTAKSMAKKRGHEWLLTLEQYTEIIKDPCYYCANELGTPVKKGSGLDRMDSERGYSLDNVVSCCAFCNGIKSDKLTPEEMKVAVKAIIDYRKGK